LLRTEDLPEGWMTGNGAEFASPASAPNCPALNPLSESRPTDYHEAKFHHGTTTLVNAVGAYPSEQDAVKAIDEYATRQQDCLHGPYTVPGGSQRTETIAIQPAHLTAGSRLVAYRSTPADPPEKLLPAGFTSLLATAQHGAFVTVVWLAGDQSDDLARFDDLAAAAADRI
jgi:hypothetical protein